MRLAEKIQLNGSDYFQLVIDRHIRQSSKVGNIGRFSLDLEKVPNVDLLENSIKNNPFFVWLSQANLASKFPFQIPKWKQSRKSNSSFIRVLEETTPLSDIDLPDDILLKDMKVGKGPLIQLDLLSKKDGSAKLIFSFHHALMDSRGAELLMRSLGQDLALDSIQPLAKPKPSEEKVVEQLNKARDVKDFLHENQTDNIALLLDGKQKSKARYSTIRFTEEESTQIEVNSKKLARFGRSPFLMAASTRAFNELLKSKGRTNESIWIPVPQDRRLKGANGPLVGNHVSYLFYRLFPDKLVDIETTVKDISDQMIGQMRQRMPQNYNVMMELFRRMPMPIYSHLSKSPTKGAFASFFFSDTGNSLAGFDQFLGAPILDATHYPPNAPYPGFTVVFMNYQEKLKVVIAHTDASATDSDIALFEECLKKDVLQ